MKTTTDVTHSMQHDGNPDVVSALAGSWRGRLTDAHGASDSFNLEREAIDALTEARPVPEFRPGDTLRVGVKVVEGDRSRVQAFEGVVIRKRGHGIGTTFTVRKISFGVGVERTFPVHSPRIESLKVLRSGKVRRAKLYYLRDLSGKAARIEEEGAAQPKAPAKNAGPAPLETATAR